MAIKRVLSKEERINKELKRLKKNYSKIKEGKMSVVDGLIYRAAYMRITLEDYEKDINENGNTEPFTQSLNTPPYDRERPVARLYNAMNKNYQSIIRQLSDLLPKQNHELKDDGFDDFINSRTD